MLLKWNYLNTTIQKIKKTKYEKKIIILAPSHVLGSCIRTTKESKPVEHMAVNAYHVSTCEDIDQTLTLN